jgi:alkyl hydroperoxide reductase subunit AhpC
VKLIIIWRRHTKRTPGKWNDGGEVMIPKTERENEVRGE